MSEEIKNNNENPPKRERDHFLVRVLRFFVRLFLVIIAFLLLISLLIQTPEVQSWAANKASEYLSEQLEAEVSIGGFRLNFLDKLKLDDVLIMEQGDTILYSGELTADFKSPVFTIFRNRLVLQNIILRNTSFIMKRRADSDEYNLDRILSKLESAGSIEKPQKNDGGLDFRLQLDNIFLEKLNFQQLDSLYGTNLYVTVDRGRLQVEKINLKEPEFLFQRLRLIKPNVHLDLYEAAIGPTGIDTAGEVPILFMTKSLRIDDATFSLDDHTEPYYTYPGMSMDYGHMYIKDIIIDASGVKFYDWETTARKLNRISLTTREGFVLNDFHADSIRVHPEQVLIDNGRIITPNSDINGDIQFNYTSFHDWLEFIDDVEMTFKSRNSKVHIHDVINFAPDLYDISLFRDNMNKNIILDGMVEGTVNKLFVRNAYAAIDSTFIRGNVRIDNSASDTEDLFLKIDLDDSRLYARRIESFVPDLKLPDGFHKMGATRLKGKFTGTTDNFKVNTRMKSRLGNGSFDFTMKLKDKIEDAVYEGDIAFDDFQLGKFINVDSIGAITMDMQISDGRGLSLESMHAHLKGKIDSFEIKRYVYHDIDIDGIATNKLFKGTLSIDDENIDAGFEGSVYFADIKKPTLDVDLEMNHINLYALNLYKEPLTAGFRFSGRVDSFDLYNLNANSRLESLELVYKDSMNLNLQLLEVIASSKPGEDNILEIDSDIVKADITGDYSFVKSWGALQNYFINSFPELSKRWQLQIDSTAKETDLVFDINFKNTQGFQALLLEDLDTIKDLRINGFIDTGERDMELSIFIPQLNYGDNSFEAVSFALFGGDGTGNVVFGINNSVLKDQINLNPISVMGDLTYDTLSFNLNLADYNKTKDNFNMDGFLYPTKDKYAMVFKDRHIHLFNNDWNISAQNMIEFGKNYLLVDSLNLTFEDKVIAFQSDRPNHLDFTLENISLATFNKNIKNDSLNIYGNMNLNLDLNNVYKLDNIQGTLEVEDFKINNDPYGLVTLQVIDDGTGTKSEVKLRAVHYNQKIFADGYVNPRNTEEFYDLDVKAEEMPFTILQYLLYESISNTSGKVDGNVKVTGAIDAPAVVGKGKLYDAKTKFDELGVTYYVKDANFSVSPTFIDLSGGEVYDKYDNVAHIQGGLTHNNFDDFGAEISINTKKFLLMDTDNEINSFYYGRIIGSADVAINGLFSQIDINIVAENAENTEFYMSLFDEEEIEDAAFVRFVGGDDTDDDLTTSIETPEGLNLRLNLTANDLARVKIFMDEGDENYIEANGRGNIILDLHRTGDISMFGTYKINSGTYRYSSFNLIKRTFRVREGGYVQWTGSPYDATMNIVADYGTNASPHSILTGYNITRQEVPQTPVHVLIYLNGPILHPSIDFDLEIPDVPGNIRPYVDNALTSLRADQSKLEFQALSLITLGDFWPDESSGSGIVYSGSANTISAFLSSQVSNFLSTIVNEALRNVGFIDYIDVDVNYTINNEIDLDNLGGPDGVPQLGTNEVQVNLKNILFNERAVLDIGGNYVEGSVISSGAYVKGNVSLEYIITEDRRLRVRMFSNTDQNIEGYQIKFGAGIKYQREFNSFGDFFEGMKNSLHKTKSETEADQQQN